MQQASTPVKFYFKGVIAMATNANSKKAIMWVAQAGLLIALLVVVQLLTFAIPKSVPLVSQLFTGSLVNLVLIVGAGSAGFSATAIAAILSPVLALLFGQMSFPQMVPVVAIGNLVIVAITWAFFNKSAKMSGGAKVGLNIAGIIVGAIVKTAVVWATTLWLIIPAFFAGNAKVSKTLGLMFSWPQLVTALIGGAIALLILPRLKTSRKN